MMPAQEENEQADRARVRRTEAVKVLAKYLTGHLVAVHSMGLEVGGSRKVHAQEFFALRSAFNVRGYATADEAEGDISHVMDGTARLVSRPEGMELRVTHDVRWTNPHVVYWHRDDLENRCGMGEHVMRGFVATFQNKLVADAFVEAANAGRCVVLP